MLAEALTWLITPAPWAARRLGYLKEAVAITARYRRCRAAWAPHLEQSRDAILAFSVQQPRRRTLVVLGSGAGLDLPLEALAPQWQRIVLVDLVHPWAIRRRAARLPQVAFATWDIAGVAATLLARPDHLPEPVPQWPLPADTDAVVSLNVMAQLPVVPLAWLSAHGMPAAACDAWAQQVVAAHWQQLATLGVATLLVTDYAATHHLCPLRATTAADAALPLPPDESTLFGFELPQPPLRQWVWRIAPCGELSPHWERQLRVGVFVP
ncbi:hypothetical protein Hthe01_10130 [Hydrogenophilus thermoluteolus]|uniref:hypothetical protein n=1 Tax=Hydrogenophilus thermoluteolus TaxID=297 RepID=UPI0024A47679|nr:hypothetical protein [Hydrogenophilus thermoluteolus]GLW60664.1 hypothetical protein Hthe01_10130 [Hydrogenophilus thermoluteolus]